MTQTVVNSKAVNFIHDWSLQKVTDHSETIHKWHTNWDNNKKFEEMILKESKGYHLEMRAMKRHFELKYAAHRDKTDFYIEGLERGLNETKLQY